MFHLQTRYALPMQQHNRIMPVYIARKTISKSPPEMWCPVVVVVVDGICGDICSSVTVDMFCTTTEPSTTSWIFFRLPASGPKNETNNPSPLANCFDVVNRQGFSPILLSWDVFHGGGVVVKGSPHIGVRGLWQSKGKNVPIF